MSAEQWKATLKPDLAGMAKPVSAAWHADRARAYIAQDAGSLHESAGGRMGPSPAILLAQAHASLAIAEALMEAKDRA